MESFTLCALSASSFVRPGATFICKRLKDQEELSKRKKQITTFAWKLLQSPSPLSRMPAERKYCKSSRHYHAKIEKAPKQRKNHRRARKGNHRRSSTLHEDLISTPRLSISSTDSLLSNVARIEFEPKIRKAKTEDRDLPVLKMVLKQYTRAVD